MSSTYGQYCLLALAAEGLGERWSILVLGRLLDGRAHFVEIGGRTVRRAERELWERTHS